MTDLRPDDGLLSLLSRLRFDGDIRATTLLKKFILRGLGSTTTSTGISWQLAGAFSAEMTWCFPVRTHRRDRPKISTRAPMETYKIERHSERLAKTLSTVVEFVEQQT
jgi:hypothetical protein